MLTVKRLKAGFSMCVRYHECALITQEIIRCKDGMRNAASGMNLGTADTPVSCLLKNQHFKIPIRSEI